MRRRLLLRSLLAALAVGTAAPAAALPRVELDARAAWSGWSRPDRSTELGLRLSTDTPTRATVSVTAGRHRVQSEIALQPGRPARLHIPVPAVETIQLVVEPAGGPAQRRELAVARSESPLLGLALLARGSDERAVLPGFHELELDADQLPRSTSAYSSIDALVVDAPTLAALDPRQLSALLAHVSGCGRVVLMNADSRVSNLMRNASGCGGRALMSAATLADAMRLLDTSLGAALPSAPGDGAIGALLVPDLSLWNQAAAAIALYFAAAAMVLLFAPRWTLAVPVLAACALPLVLHHAMQPISQLAVWGEGDADAQWAHFRAVHRIQGVARNSVQLPIPQLLGPSALPCDRSQSTLLQFDAASGQASHARFDTRLFGQASLCHSGNFPISRSLVVETGTDGRRRVRNAGSAGWPAGMLLAGGRGRNLPALGPGAHADIVTDKGESNPDPEVRIALSRLPSEGVAGLWALDLSGVTEAPIDSKGWLFVSAAQR